MPTSRSGTGRLLSLRRACPGRPCPGTTAAATWTGRIADADLPQAKNPAANRIVDRQQRHHRRHCIGNNPFSAVPTPTCTRSPTSGYRAAAPPTLLSAKAARLHARRLHRHPGRQLLPARGRHRARALGLVPGPAARRSTAQGLGPAVDLLAHWSSAANARRFTTPTGLSSTDPAGAAVRRRRGRGRLNASMLFHALLPRLAARLLDAPRSSVEVGGRELDTRTFLAMTGGQSVAKYLVALVQYAAGGTPAVPAQHLPPEPVPRHAARTRRGGRGRARGHGGLPLLRGRLRQRDPVRLDLGAQAPGHLRQPARPAPACALFNYGPFANDGGLYTVDVGELLLERRRSANGFIQHAGPNVRFSAEMIADGQRGLARGHPRRRRRTSSRTRTTRTRSRSGSRTRRATSPGPRPRCRPRRWTASSSGRRRGRRPAEPGGAGR